MTAALLFPALPGGSAHAVSGSTAAVGDELAFTARLTVAGPRSCSAALIDPSWIVTAKACFQDSSGGAVRAGVAPGETKATVGRTELAVHELVPHAERDVVLARLADPVRDVSAVKVASTAPRPGEVVTIAGYGRTTDEWVPDTVHSAQATIGAVESSTLEISGNAPGSGSPCKGDAGGPTLRRSGSGMELVAIHHTSGQAGCLGESSTSNSAVETRIDDLADWITRTTSTVRPALWSNQAVRAQLVLRSPSGEYSLWFQEDGNLVVYRRDGGYVWETRTHGTGATEFYNQGDGNLVLYRPDGEDVWDSCTSTDGPSTLWLQDDGNLVLYRNRDGIAVWDIRKAQCRPGTPRSSPALAAGAA
ncbi:MAG TPA: trypsin-like serine protease [Micromonosporaceae bacterium]|nr:trypsin-like serine protease [Micromonosporaceae bacterium]